MPLCRRATPPEEERREEKRRGWRLKNNDKVVLRMEEANKNKNKKARRC